MRLLRSIIESRTNRSDLFLKQNINDHFWFLAQFRSNELQLKARELRFILLAAASKKVTLYLISKHGDNMQWNRCFLDPETGFNCLRNRVHTWTQVILDFMMKPLNDVGHFILKTFHDLSFYLCFNSRSFSDHKIRLIGFIIALKVPSSSFWILETFLLSVTIIRLKISR